MTIEFCSLVLNVSCIIEKDNEYYPEIYLDECLYVKDNTEYKKTPVLWGGRGLFFPKNII